MVYRYFASEEHKTGKPPPGELNKKKNSSHSELNLLLNLGKVFDPPPVEIDVTTETDKPFSLKQVISICKYL